MTPTLILLGQQSDRGGTTHPPLYSVSRVCLTLQTPCSLAFLPPTMVLKLISFQSAQTTSFVTISLLIHCCLLCSDFWVISLAALQTSQLPILKAYLSCCLPVNFLPIMNLHVHLTQRIISVFSCEVLPILSLQSVRRSYSSQGSHLATKCSRLFIITI